MAKLPRPCPQPFRQPWKRRCHREQQGTTNAPDATRAVSPAGMYEGVQCSICQRMAHNDLPGIPGYTRGHPPFDQGSTEDALLSDFKEFFGPGGTVEKFRTSLAPFHTGREAREIEGAILDLDRHMLDALTRAAEIKQAFFADGSEQPRLRFEVTAHQTTGPGQIGPGQHVIGSVLDVDGVKLESTQGLAFSKTVTWPSNIDDPHTKVGIKIAGDQGRAN